MTVRVDFFVSSVPEVLEVLDGFAPDARGQALTSDIGAR